MAKLKKKENHMKFKEIQREKGITLIALVITIIVLLILAGVSIAMLTGQNGILTQAQKSKSTTELKSAEEKVKLAIMAARSQSETGALDADKLIAEITNNYGGTASKTNNGFPLNITIDEKNFIIDDDGNVMKKELIAADIANATQKEIAQHIGKSERTVKSMTVNLSERGIIERKNGRRNGFWEIKK